MVIAITSETGDMQGILDHVWKHLLTAVKATGAPDGKEAQADLQKKLSTLALPLTPGKPTADIISKLNGKSFKIADNDLKISKASFEFAKGWCLFRMYDDKGEHLVVNGIGNWKLGLTDLSPMPLKLVLTPVPNDPKTMIAGNGAWLDENTFEMTWRFIETAHYETVTCKFESDTVQIEFKKSLAIIAKTKDPRPVLSGKMLA